MELAIDPAAEQPYRSVGKVNCGGWACGFGDLNEGDNPRPTSTVSRSGRIHAGRQAERPPTEMQENPGKHGRSASQGAEQMPKPVSSIRQ